ncbi:hypothetical protein AFLA_008870 [Aspergillus flavus NRRL3357]|nr:hypothetical protein AFLA_008870 [Aspergillus flavus NRRL3357]
MSLIHVLLLHDDNKCLTLKAVQGKRVGPPKHYTYDGLCSNRFCHQACQAMGTSTARYNFKLIDNGPRSL